MPLDRPAIDEPTEPPIEEPALPARYQILGKVAQGGLGKILKAFDPRLNRSVALKEPLSNADEDRARFLREAHITARLQHPSIIPVYELGAWPSGKPFYSMKMVSGRPLQEIISEKKTLAARLTLLPQIIAVADAVAYAHSERIVHRDLNPSNILIGPFGEAVVIDWGLGLDLSEMERGPERRLFALSTISKKPALVDAARKRNLRASVTEDGAVMGTAQYMSPEQARGERVDERADVYAIGAILYHLLAGIPAYPGSDSLRIVERVRRRAPVALEKRQPAVPKDLLAIVKKAMKRDIAKRYRNAIELAEDLKRFQTGQLVSAHYYTNAALVRRWIQKHKLPVIVTAFSIVALAAVALIGLSRVLLERNIAQHEKAVADNRSVELEEQKELLQKSRNDLFLYQVESALDRDPTAAVGLLKNYPEAARQMKNGSKVAFKAVSEGVARHVFAAELAFAFSPDGAFLASGKRNGELSVWNLDTGKRALVLSHPGVGETVKFSPDGRSLVSYGPTETKFWLTDLVTGKTRTFEGHQASVYDVDFSPDGRWIVSASADHTVRLWERDTGFSQVRIGHQGLVYRVRFAPTGEYFVSAAWDGTVRTWSTSNRSSQVLKAEGAILALAISRQGKRIATTGTDGVLRVWDLPSGHLTLLRGQPRPVSSVAFSADGNLVATGGHDSTVRLWSLPTRQTRVLHGHSGRVSSVAFSPDGRFLLSAGQDQVVRLWDVSSGNRVFSFRGHQTEIERVAFSPDGKMFASQAFENHVRVWKTPTRLSRTLHGSTDGIFDLSLSPDGTRLATAGRSDSVRIWQTETGESLALKGTDPFVYRVQFSPDAKFLASAGFDTDLRLWELSTGKTRTLRGHKSGIWDLAFSFKSDRLASAGRDGVIRVANLTSGETQEFRGHEGEVRSIAYSPSGEWIASGGADSTVRLWSVSTGSNRLLDTSKDGIFKVAFSPDGRLLAWATGEGLVKLWSSDTEQILTFVGHAGPVRSLSFSPNGLLLATAGEDRTVRLWDVNGVQQHLFEGHRDIIFQVTFSPDGQLIASASADGTAQVWRVSSENLLFVVQHDDYVRRAAFSSDSKYIVTASLDQTLKISTIQADSEPDDRDIFSWITNLTTASLYRAELVTREETEVLK